LRPRAERLIEDNVKLNRNVLVQFIDYIDEDDREEFREVLTEVDMSGGSPENMKAHVEQVSKEYFSRQVRVAFNRGFKTLNDTGEPDKALTDFNEYIEGLMAGRYMENGSLARRIDEHMEYVKNLPDEDEQGSKMFGLPSLDEVRGPDPGTGELIIIAGPPKSGKSSLFNNIVLSHALRGEPLFFGSAEMDARKTTERLVAAASGVSSKMVGSKLVIENKVAKKAFKQGVQKLDKENVFIEYSPLSLDYVKKVVYTHYYRYKVKTYVFDRIGLFEETSGSNEFQGRRKVTLELRKLVNELPELKIILGSQIVNESARSRNTRPMPHHVFGGTGGQADCTQLYLIYRPFHIDPSADKFQFGPWTGAAVKATMRYSFTEVYCPLNSNGPANGTALLVLDSHRQVFEDQGKNKFVDNLFDFRDELERIEAGENTFESYEPPHLSEDDDEEDDKPVIPVSDILGAKGTVGKKLF